MIVLYMALAGVLASGASFFVGQYMQREDDRAAYEAELGRQIVKAGKAHYESEERLAQVNAEFRQWKVGYLETVSQGQKVLVQYVKSPEKKCVVNDELQRAYAQLVVLHNPVPGTDHMQATDEATGGFNVPRGGAGRDAADVGGITAAKIDDSITFEAWKICMEDRTEVRSRLKRFSAWAISEYHKQREALGYEKETP